LGHDWAITWLCARAILPAEWLFDPRRRAERSFGVAGGIPKKPGIVSQGAAMGLEEVVAGFINQPLDQAHCLLISAVGLTP